MVKTREDSKPRVTQAELARRLKKKMGVDFSRDKVWELENGSPRVPPADIVHAVADALDRPITEALEALGYVLPKESRKPVHPSLANSASSLPWSIQERIAELIPSLVSLAGAVAQVSTLSVPTETEAVSSNVKEPAATSEMLSTRGERRETESAQQSDNTSAAEGVHKNVPVLPREVESVDQAIRRRRPPAR